MSLTINNSNTKKLNKRFCSGIGAVECENCENLVDIEESWGVKDVQKKKEELIEAINLAYEMIETTIEKLQKSIKEQSEFTSVFFNFESKADRYKQILNDFITLKSKMEINDIDYDLEDEVDYYSRIGLNLRKIIKKEIGIIDIFDNPDFYASTSPRNAGKIQNLILDEEVNIYNKFFTVSKFRRAQIIIHELTHVELKTGDKGYLTIGNDEINNINDVINLERDTPVWTDYNTQLNNADNWGWFAAEAWEEEQNKKKDK